MPSSKTKNPRVLISYSHDSQEHMDRVLVLSNRLRADGIDCIIDQYETSPPEGWARWCDNQIEKADFILVVCTETYERRFKGIEEPGKGKGVKWEGAIITQQLYDSEAINRQFIPVIFSPGNQSHIPIILRGATFYIPNTEEGYEALYRHITNQPSIIKPGMGELKSMPPRSRKQEFHGFYEPPWNVPFPRNPYFIGREQVIGTLHDALKSDSTVQVIRGLGGIGKTQTAVEYSYRYRKEYKAVLWVRANSRETLVSDYASLAQVLDLPEKDAKEQNIAVAAVKHWLINNPGWLLVFDNADEQELLEDFFPINSKGNILLTSRAKNFTRLGIANRVDLDKMSPGEAKEFLLKRTERSTLPLAEIEALENITKELDYLPLALEQAGAYILELECSFQDYLYSYHEGGLKLLQEFLPVTGKYPGSVATTWLLNFEQVEKTSKASADLLRISAFLNSDNIPLELIILGASELGEIIPKALANIKTNPLILDKLLLPLTQYSLITRDIRERTYSIHRLVQGVIRYRMGKDEQRLWAERTILAMNKAFPSIEFSSWHLCDRLLPHAMACAGLIKYWRFEFKEAARLLSQSGAYQYKRAQYAEVEPLFRRALEIFEKSLGSEHPDVATLLNNLAELYRVQGRYAEAEPSYRRALEIRKKSLGSDHPDVATSLNNLAALYDEQGKYVETEPLYRRALEIFEESLGSDHPDVANPLNNLAFLYREQGKYAEAEPLYKHSLEICKKSYGSNHPYVATLLSNLAELYGEQGKYAEAEPLCRRALEIRERSLGSNHPDVANSLNNLALLYDNQGKYAEAEPFYRRSLEICKKSLGENHPNTTLVLKNLAALLQKMQDRIDGGASEDNIEKM